MKKQTAQEQYYQLKLQRIAKRKKFWQRVPDLLHVVFIGLLGISIAVLVITVLFTITRDALDARYVRREISQPAEPGIYFPKAF